MTTDELAKSAIRLDQEWIFAPMDLPKLAEAVETERVLNDIDKPSEIVMTSEQFDEYNRLCLVPGRYSSSSMRVQMMREAWTRASIGPNYCGIPIRVAS